MAKYRAIQTDFWEDGFVLDLTPEEKYFYLYILSNPRTTQCGCHELPYKVIEMQTGYNRETVEKLLQRFVDYGKIEYSPDTKEILIKNWHKFNFTKSPKVMNCILKEISEIKNQDFKNYMIEVCIDYGYPMDTLSIDYGEKQKQKQKQKQKEKEKEKQQQAKNTVSPVVVDKIKSYFDLKDEDIQTIYEALISVDKDISYLDEKLQITKNSNVKNVTGFIIKAIKDNYTLNSKTTNSMSQTKYKTGAGAGVNETFRQYTPDELEALLRESQKGKFD